MIALAKTRIRLKDRAGKRLSETMTGIKEGFLAILLFVLTQLIICGIQEILDRLPLDFSAPIISMTLVFAVTLLIGLMFNFEATDAVYRKYLKAPTDLLNRHMSIGFTVPLLKIAVEPRASPKDIGLIICCYCLTGILNSVFVYTCARSLQKAIQRLHQRRVLDPEQQLHRQEARRSAIDCCPSIRDQLAVFDARPKNCHSETSTLVNNIKVDGECDILRASQRRISTLLGIARKHFTLVACFLFILAVALPLSLVAGSDVALDTSLLFFLWLAILTAHSNVKGAACLEGRLRLRAFLATSLNAVLWTSLAMIGYAWAKTAAQDTTIKDTISRLVTGTNIDTMIRQMGASGLDAKPVGMGAGDIAMSILNAGIVSWGLKLFECRSQLLSRAGVTVLVVCTVAAAANVVFGPLLAYAIGLRPASRDLAFAARSVTIALGGPAIEALGADGGLNAVMVVFNGIIFQMMAGMGFRLRADVLKRIWTSRASAEGSEKAEAREDGDLSKHLRPESKTTKDGDESIVANGVAVGINAAAMGTCHLYERGSLAAPYSTISMTVFGVMTVVFTSIGPLTKWLIAQVSQ